MQILEKISYGNGAAIDKMIDSLADVLVLSARLPGNTDWRDRELLARYAEYKRSHTTADVVAEICRRAGDNQFVVERTPFPQSGLENIYPFFTQFTIWSLVGEKMGLLRLPEVTKAAFGNSPRVTFWNDGHESIPECWHVHSMVFMIDGLVSNR